MLEVHRIKVGRPALTENQSNSIFRKLEPYLLTGVSLHKSCLEAKIPKSTVYDLMRENEEFAENVDRAKNFMFVTYLDINFTRLVQIYKKVMKNEELTNSENSFIMWLGTHSKSFEEEFQQCGRK
jgi:hypothetical protein